MNLDFDGRGLLFLRHYMAKNDIRYYLNGICLRPMRSEHGGGVLGVATNGHVMGMWHDPDGVVEREVVIATTPGLFAACRPGRGRREPRLALRDGRLAVVSGDVEVFVQGNGGRTLKGGVQPWEIGGRFPVVERVVRRPETLGNGLAGAFNLHYLGLIAGSLPKGKNGFASSVVARQDGENGSAQFYFESEPRAAVVLMPLRGLGEPPKWLSVFARDAEARAKAADTPLPVHEPSDAGPRDDDYRGWAAIKKEAA